jgi:hypothetical protein
MVGRLRKAEEEEEGEKEKEKGEVVWREWKFLLQRNENLTRVLLSMSVM